MVAWIIVSVLVGALGGFLIERVRARGQLIRDAMNYSWRVFEKDGNKRDFIDIFRNIRKCALDG